MCSSMSFESSSRTAKLVTPPFDAIRPQYVAYLRSQRYADDTIQRYLASLAHFARRLNKGTPLADIDEVLVAEFVDSHVPNCDCPRPCMRHVATVRAALRHLLCVLKQQGLNVARRTPPRTSIDVELEVFKRHLIDICGYAPTTCSNRLWHIRRFLCAVFGQGPVVVARLSPKQIESYITQCGTNRSHASRRACCVDLASYLRFRNLQGDDIHALLAAIPPMAPARPTRLPVAMTDKEADLFFTAFDLSTSIGMRDFAIARCLADLALRRMEVVRLRLESFNWREATVTLTHNKSGRERKLPLPARTAEAIVRYLQDGRPTTCSRAVFVRHIAPYDKPIGAGAINDLVSRAFARVGLDRQCHGVHVLRRTAATRLVQGGASLKEIADVLGHKHLNTTKLYTSVDIARLRTIAQPWPGDRP